MKKKILSLALLAMAFAGTSAFAQTPDNQATCTKENKECCKGKQGRPDKMRGQRPDFFKGIELTADQQQKIQALQSSRKENKELKKDGKERRNPGEERREYLNNVKGILTPDQYVVFLENIVVEQPMGPGHAMRPGAPRMHKKMHNAGDLNRGRANRTDASLNK